MIEMNLFNKAHEITLPIVELALKSDDKKGISQILTVIGACEIAEDNIQNACEHLEEALKISKEIGDTGSIASASFWLGNAQQFNCEFEKAEINIRRSEKIALGAKIPWRAATLKSLLSHMIYYSQGRMDLAYETSHQAIKIATNSDDIYSKIFAFSCHGAVCFGKGLFQEAIKYLSKGREFSAKLNFNWWHSMSNHFLGEVYFELKQYKKAINHYQTAVSFFDSFGNWPSATIMNKVGLIRTKIINNTDDNDMDTVFQLVSVAKAKLYKGLIRRYISEIYFYLNEDRITEAEEWIRKAINADEGNRIPFELSRDYTLYAKILKRKGEKALSVEYMDKALDIYSKCGANGWVEKYEKE